MSITMLDGTKKEERFSGILVEILEEIEEALELLKLEDMNIKPCRNCGGCTYKTPGVCIAKDDTSIFMRNMVKTDRFGVLTYISFGGYSSVTKKAIDKLALMGLPSFIVYKGRLQHPFRYPKENIRPNVVIAITDGNSELEKQSFKKLVEANALITMTPFKLVFIDANETQEIIKQKLIKAFKEVK